jgi:glucosylceramidase
MNDPKAGQWIKGVGMQWAGKGAVAEVRARYPQLRIYQSEQECGDGRNEWSYAGYCWGLMKHYLERGVAGYMYWNISLAPGGLSHWGWPQNSLVAVDPASKSYQWNHDYYILKHISHFVQPGARRLDLDGTHEDALAFVNPDKSFVVVARNESARERALDIRIGDKTVQVLMAADSLSTLLLPAS